MHSWADQALKNRGLYANATERWNLKDRTIFQKWMESKTHFIDTYEKMLAANGGTTMGQEGYGTGGAYSAIDDDGSSLEESILQYADRATHEEVKWNDASATERWNLKDRTIFQKWMESKTHFIDKY